MHIGLPYPALSCLVLSCPILSYPVLSRLASRENHLALPKSRTHAINLVEPSQFFLPFSSLLPSPPCSLLPHSPCPLFSPLPFPPPHPHSQRPNNKANIFSSPLDTVSQDTQAIFSPSISTPSLSFQNFFLSPFMRLDFDRLWSVGFLSAEIDGWLDGWVDGCGVVWCGVMRAGRERELGIGRRVRGGRDVCWWMG